MRKLTRFFSVVVALITAFGLVACATDYPDDSSSSSGSTDKITVAFDRETLTMDEWDTERISVSASDNSAVNVTSADNSILYIRGSNVTALKAGTTTLTAVAVKDKTATATMTVVVNAKPENKPVLTVSGPESLAIGASGKFVASLGKVDATDYSVEWSVSDTSKARVDANGNVTALKAGTVDVNAAVKYRSVDFTAKASLEINREITVVFGSDEETAKFDLSDIAEVSGEYTLTLNGKTYTADSDGKVTLAKDDFDTTDGNKFDGTLVCGANTYAFKLVVYMAGDAMAYQDGQLMTPDANGHFTVDKTAAADENGLRWITFDSAESMIEKGYELLTLKIKFNAFSTANAGIIDDTISAYNYNFGYKYTEPETDELVWLFWDNNYQGQAYGGAMKPDHHAPYGYGYIKIYDTAGNLILDYYKKQINDAAGTHGNWSDYVNPLQTNTEYVFVLDISKTGDIAFSGLDDAVITEIKWGKKDETVLTFAKTATIDEWQTLELNATVNDDSEIVYELIDSDGVLYLDGNKVVGLKAGTAKVKATANGKTAQMAVTVNENEANRPVLTVTGDDTVDVYQSAALTAKLKCGSTEISSSAYSLTYSATGDFLSVNNGVIVGLKAGETTITATAVYCGKTFTATHAVTVTDTTTPVDPSVGKLYQGGTQLTADKDGNYTMRADIDDKTLTFDNAEAKIALGYTKLRVSVKFSDLTDERVVIGKGGSYAFGYYYKNVKVGWYNSYNHRDDLFGAYVGAFEGDNASPLAYGYLRVYNANAEKIFEHYEVGDWSSNPNVAYGYIDPLAVNTVYIFEFDVAKTSDITLVGFENATFTKVEWINPSSATVTFEESEKTVDEWTEFTVKATASDGSDVVYSTENTDVIAISGNKVIGLKAGTATITATANGKTAQMTVTVTENADKRPALAATLKNEIEVAESVGVTATLTSGTTVIESADYVLSIVSANEAIAKVQSGSVVGVAAGTVKITVTATYFGIEFEKEISITVKVAEDPTVGKLYQGGTQLTADENGVYRVNTTVSGDSEGKRWLTVDSAKASVYPYMRFKVKFNSFVATSTLVGYDYHFGFNYGAVRFFWCNNYTGGGFGGALDTSNSATQNHYFNIYTASNNAKVLNAMTTSGWSSYYTLSENVEYVFEFNVGAMGSGFTFCGFDDAEISDITWAEAILA